MSKIKEPSFGEQFPCKEGAPSSGTACPTGDVYLSGLAALRGELAALRADEPVLNKLERVSVNALITYAAYDTGVSEDVVRAIVETRFNVDDISKIQGCDYEDVIRYLVDLNPKAIIN
ncbi:MAG: hypothetical protein P4L53_10895 [Candidatus Obscuribacterales bacterium]|nr:hypothetical protein [Candidatus Obscuribacterales bacterium]